MRVLSVITAVDPARAEHLDEAGASLAAQAVPSGWEVEWVVQHDEGAHGPAVTRMAAAARARGELYRVLDADDLLLPGDLERVVALLDGTPDVDWVASRALDLLPDGSTCRWEGNPAPGRLPRGSVYRAWLANDHRPNVHPAALTVRARAFWSVGGWAALERSEDTALLLALDAVGDGWFLDEPGMLYRQWQDQVTQEVESDPEDPAREARHEAIRRRVEALRSAVETHARSATLGPTTA